MSAAYLNAEDLGQRIGKKSSDTMLRWFHAGIIPGLKIGGNILFDFEEVKAALEKLKAKQVKAKQIAGKYLQQPKINIPEAL